MTDAILVVTGILLSATTFAAIEYYRHVRRAQKEYERAKEAVDDIVFSFNRQLKREAEKLEALGYKIEAIRGKNDGASARADGVLRKVDALETKFVARLEVAEQLRQRLDEVERKTRDLVASNETLETRFSGLEEQTKAVLTASEPGPQAVIPIRREKAMGQLTETELSVLEYLASDGPKTAPEIKERVKLSREHTARLMKKLYEGGYLERETGKIPFRYSVKKEMEKLLKKPERQAA